MVRIELMPRSPQLVDHLLRQVLPVILIAAVGMTDLEQDTLVILDQPQKNFVGAALTFVKASFLALSSVVPFTHSVILVMGGVHHA